MKKNLLRYLMIFLMGIMPIIGIACTNEDARYPTEAPPLVTIPNVVQHVELSTDAREAPTWQQLPDEPGVLISLGYVRPNERDLPPSERSQNIEYHLEKGEPFELLLILYSSVDTTYMVTAVLNYQQVPFELDGKFGLVHEVNIKGGIDQELPLRIEVPDSGFNDLMVIGFQDANNGSLQFPYRNSLGTRMIGARANVFVGEGITPAGGLPTAVSGTPFANDVSFTPHALLSKYDPSGATHPTEMDQQLYRDIAEPGTVYPYRIWVSNTLPDTKKYAVMQFVNYQQVPIDGHTAVVAELAQGYEAGWDAQISLPNEEGVNQIQVVYVEEPYRQNIEHAIIFGSQRAAVWGTHSQSPR